MSDTINTERLTEKIIVEQTPNHLHVQFDTPHPVISSAVLGGGAEYIAVCLPAFTPETVNRDDKIR